jgi:hypothetical protein
VESNARKYSQMIRTGIISLTVYVLQLFGKKASTARPAYRAYVQKGISQGRRPELVGGGLIRSAGGWSAVTAMRRAKDHMKSSELGMDPKQVWSHGKHPPAVKARSLLCYWAVRKLGYTATELSKRLGVSQPSVSISVKRGEKIARAEQLQLEKK